VKELRRGSDSAIIYGVAFRRDEAEVCVWSDKGTIHVFKLNESEGGASNRQSTLSPFSGYLHKYFSSQWSYAQYRLPSSSTHISLNAATSGSRPTSSTTEEERCTVGWIEVPVVVTPPLPPQAHKASSGQRPTPPPSRQVSIEHQLVALTFSGCWYRLSPPSSPSSKTASESGGSSSSSRRMSSSSTVTTKITEKGKDRAKREDGEGDPYADRPGRDCTLVEFKRFGRWDGWG